MKDKIKDRLQDLYKEQARLTDKSKVWIQPQNSLSQRDLILVNSYIIKELEILLEFMDKTKEKYSIPVYENGKDLNKPLEGIVGDEQYEKLIKYGKGELPIIINVNTK